MSLKQNIKRKLPCEEKVRNAKAKLFLNRYFDCVPEITM